MVVYSKNTAITVI